MDYQCLELLARSYRSPKGAMSEIINLQAILNLPKGTEHFLSDLHGEADTFLHILKNASGVIRTKIDMIFDYSDRAPEGRSRRPHLLSRRAARDRQAGRKRHGRMVSADPAEAHRGAQSRRFQVYAQQGEKGAPAGLYVRHRRADQHVPSVHQQAELL